MCTMHFQSLFNFLKQQFSSDSLGRVLYKAGSLNNLQNGMDLRNCKISWYFVSTQVVAISSLVSYHIRACPCNQLVISCITVESSHMYCRVKLSTCANHYSTRLSLSGSKIGIICSFWRWRHTDIYEVDYRSKFFTIFSNFSRSSSLCLTWTTSV